jgi:hypothetical protein
VARSCERATAAPVPGKRQPDAEQQHPSRLGEHRDRPSANKCYHSMKFVSFFGPFTHAVNTRTVGLKNPGKSPLAWIPPSPREASHLVWRFFCAPGRAHFLGCESPLHTRHGEVLAERHRHPPRGGAGGSPWCQDMVQRWGS